MFLLDHNILAHISLYFQYVVVLFTQPRHRRHGNGGVENYGQQPLPPHSWRIQGSSQQSEPPSRSTQKEAEGILANQSH